MRALLGIGVALSFAIGMPAVSLAQESGEALAKAAPAESLSDEWRDPDLDVFYPRRGHASIKVGANGGVRSLFGSAIGLGGIDVAAGVDTKVGSFYGAIGGAGGQTESGLSYAQFQVGPDLEWSIDILRLGVHPRIGYIAIGRVTESEPFELLSAGVGALVGLDLYRDDGVTFALGVEPRLEWASSVGLYEDGDDAFIAGANAFLQIRFRVAKRAPKVDGGAF